MNQVEIAKKILEQGNCMEQSCNGCQFNGECFTLNKHELVFKAEQWLKKRESVIDLSVNQIVDPPVKCWMRCSDEQWNEEYLYSIDHRTNFPFGGYCNEYEQCSLTDPNAPTKKIKKWERVEDVPVELFGKALVKMKEEEYHYAVMFSPLSITQGFTDKLATDLVYLPLGQPLTGEWLPFESEE